MPFRLVIKITKWKLWRNIMFPKDGYCPERKFKFWVIYSLCGTRFIQKNVWQELLHKKLAQNTFYGIYIPNTDVLGRFLFKDQEQAAEKAAHIHIVCFCDTICHNHIFGVETKTKSDLEMLFYILVIVMFND